MSTIAAISSPIGAGGIGIVRVSGEEALRIADAIFSFDKKGEGWQPLRMNLGSFCAKDFTDKGYAVYFPPKSAYTGEPTVEFYLHGGVRIMQGALDTLLSSGARLAKNGEFTKRAFLAGRLTLADAEGVIDMINAESAAALNVAYRLMTGELSKRLNGLIDKLGDLISGIEAAIDYPDEMEDEVLPSLEGGIKDVLCEVNKLLDSAPKGRIAKHGLRAVLSGSANAGKSSLLNAMLMEDRAIVAEAAGTTRDVVEGDIECDGVKITVVDTAGLRDSEDSIEAEGVRRAKSAIKGADVVLHVIDRGQPEDMTDFGDALVFDVYTKCDLYGYQIPRKAYTYAVSAKNGTGIEELKKAIASLYALCPQGGELVSNERHISALYRAKRALEAAITSIDGTLDCTLIDLNEAYNALGEIVGKTATEDIIDKVFERFCVGK